MRRKFGVIFGTRPEVIKLAPVIRELQRREQNVVKISTGQHFSMLWQALDFFGISVDHDLGAMREGQTLSELLARITADCDAILRSEDPDVVIVQGDTATALGGALAAYLSHVEVAHVEAGLRTCDGENPFPEEINRSLIARVARWHFCPTEGAKQNLIAERIDGSRLFVTGNTIVDALQIGLAKANGGLTLSPQQLAAKLNVGPELLRRFVLVTSHRRENFGPALVDICSAIRELEQTREDVSIVWPVHLNPHVRMEVQRALSDCGPRVICLEPVNYELMLMLLKACTFILTDSGGIQEEAAFFHKPVLIMRKATERPEILHSGGGLLVGTDAHAIVHGASQLLDDSNLYRSMAAAPNPFGDGRAAERIVQVLTQ
jgi:UDP-N-acetylglucosamine 2-epimerase (non-hydrolysing)